MNGGILFSTAGGGLLNERNQPLNGDPVDEPDMFGLFGIDDSAYIGLGLEQPEIHYNTLMDMTKITYIAEHSALFREQFLNTLSTNIITTS